MKKNEKTERKKKQRQSGATSTARGSLIGFIADKPDQYDGFAILRLATKVSWRDKTSGEWQSHQGLAFCVHCLEWTRRGSERLQQGRSRHGRR